MGRFTAVRRYTIPGTERVVYLRAMSAVTSRAFRESALAALAAQDGDERESVLEVLQAKLDVEGKQFEAIAAHAFDDAECTTPTFVGPEAVADELADFQVDGLFGALSDRSGFTKEAADLAKSFPEDGVGETGSVPDPSDVPAVRATPERPPERFARATGS